MVLNSFRVYCFVMKRWFLIIVCLVLLSGCIEQKDDKGKPLENGRDWITVKISSPYYGQVLQGDKDVLFEAKANGGKEPYSYHWTSTINGELSNKNSFRMKPSDLKKGRHMIIAVATDANGVSGQGTAQINVM